MRLSVIIPTLNEAQFISKTLESVNQEEVEIIVVDAGSEDDTIRIIKDQVKVIKAPDLKGKKFASLNLGASVAHGEVLVFLDADTLLPKGYATMIAQVLDTGAIGGAFIQRFDQAGWFLRLLEILNQIRYRSSGRYFGDQALFCLKSAFEKVGGYPEIPIMESAHFCSQLKRVGSLKLVNEPCITSSRRFLEGGTIRVFLFDLRIWIKDLLTLDTKKEAAKYWIPDNRRQ